MKTTGAIIKELREIYGMSKQRLAELVGAKSYTTITKWESNENHPRGKEIKILCNLFNVSADYLLGLKEDNVPILYSYRYIPVSISAGLPMTVEAIEECECSTITLPDEIMGKWARNDEVFFVRANGDSMNKVFPHGSLLGVKDISSIDKLNDNDIIVFSFDNEYSVKRFKRNPKSSTMIFRPESFDETFTDIVIDEEQSELLQIIGKVVIYVVAQ